MTERKPDAKQSPWTPDRVELLRAMWVDGQSTSQIARALGTTASAVISKTYRIMLPRREPVQPRRESPWTPESVDLLKTMWSKGYSAQQISNVLGFPSRNAVIGKVGRLGLLGRRRGANQPKSRKRKSPHIPNAPIQHPSRPIRPGDMPEPKSEGLSLLDLTDRTCRFPHGDPGDDDFHFCGAAKEIGAGPYCPYHMRVTYSDKAARMRARERWEAENQPKRKSRLMFELEIL